MKTDKALEAAYDILDLAHQSHDNAFIVECAEKAIKKSPICVDAYVMLGYHKAQTPEEANEYFMKGVEIGLTLIDPEDLAEKDPMLWGYANYRPFMRAKRGSASALWECGKHDDAIKTCREILRLNSNDNQGVRYDLMRYLLELGLFGDIAKLLAKFPEDTGPQFAYTKALLKFMEASDQLKAAWNFNPYVPGAMMIPTPFLDRAYSSYQVGGIREGEMYAFHAKEAWMKIPGAINWLTSVTSPLTLKDGASAHLPTLQNRESWRKDTPDHPRFYSEVDKSPWEKRSYQLKRD